MLLNFTEYCIIWINFSFIWITEKILLQQGQPIVKGVIGRFKKKQKSILNTVKNMWYDQV